MKSNLVLSLLMLVGSVCVCIAIYFLVPSATTVPSPTPCVCKAESCPASTACPVVTHCPPQPTLEIVRPFSVEAQAVIAGCRDEVQLDNTAIQAAQSATNQAMDVARKAGVSSTNYDWLDNADARRAATDLMTAKNKLDEAIDKLFSSVHKCRGKLTDLFDSLPQVQWLDSMLEHRIDDPIFEFFDESFLYRAECNAVARRLECPLPEHGR
jgi:hypothetical protein